ncbi:MAG TPA: ABC transporter permease [Acetobacteraceae bacterium]|nr:ABC transporter permease [Acetobacteraceae bacterium]
MSSTVLAPALPVPESPARVVLGRFLAHRSAMLGLALCLLFVAVAVAAPLISPVSPTATDWSAIRQPPSWAHWMGTDEIGRDELARVIFGARASLLAGVVSVLIAALIGVPAGLAAGFAHGTVDAALSRIVDAMLAIPFLVLAIALAAFLGPNLRNAMIAIGITTAPVFMRITRGATMDVMTHDYIEAARAVGNRPWRVAVRHVMPNIFPPILVQGTLSIATSIIAEASLSFLGLGEQPPTAAWGSMLNAAQQFLTQAPWLAIFPGAAIFLTVLGFNLMGDGLRDALDPRGS